MAAPRVLTSPNSGGHKATPVMTAATTSSAVMKAKLSHALPRAQLRGRTVASNDIRAGAAMVIAALCAEGETMITDVRYIERGYSHLDEKLRSLGASIEKLESEGSED